MAAEQDALLAYFAGTPAQFQADADVVLQLRGGEHLPAHSQLLASTSPVLCDMLKVAASQVLAGGKIVLPLHGWGSSKEAVDVLKARVQQASAGCITHDVSEYGECCARCCPPGVSTNAYVGQHY